MNRKRRYKTIVIFLFTSLLTNCDESDDFTNNSIGNTNIEEAIINNDINSVKQIISRGFDINTSNKEGHLLISVAIENNSFDIVNLLIENQSELIYFNEFSNTFYNSVEELKMKFQFNLIKKYIDISYRDNGDIFTLLSYIPSDYFNSLIHNGFDIKKERNYYINGIKKGSTTYFEEALRFSRYDLALIIYKHDKDITNNVPFFDLCKSSTQDLESQIALGELTRLLLKDGKIIYGELNEYGVMDIEFAIGSANYYLLKVVLEDGFQLSDIGLHDEDDVLSILKPDLFQLSEEEKADKIRYFSNRQFQVYFLLLSYL